MSKLAAICAKLNGGAVMPSQGVAALFDSPKSNAEERKSKECSLDISTMSTSNLPDTKLSDSLSAVSNPSPGSQDGLGTTIGVLKRKSIMPLSSGASRRKRQRPTSIYDENHETGKSENDETQSMDGSEHSLHIDLPEEGETKKDEDKKTKSKDSKPFNKFSDASAESSAASLISSGVLGLSAGDVISNIMASQSLAAFAQHASALNTDGLMPYKGISSPASVSAESLNDSQSKISIPTKIGANKQKKEIDYVQYMKRYSNGSECGSAYCIGMNYKDHYHCIDCKSKIFVKKEEMIRHYKWHKKRDDSLQHGFMRYSPFDDCTSRFGPCAHNKKQTHYHCVQTGCNKVYVSTSDVQMHANYHRKASAIIMEGFQRFRATEDCGTPTCDFYSQRTTHFHCRRTGCNFTFKNKADMEKHKTYHQKDEILAKDGFKKYMKYEHCPYPGCAYSKLSNHIHCMRPGCMYVLHSTSQLYPHKRKHEKKDMDSSFPKYEPIAPSPVRSGATAAGSSSKVVPPATNTIPAATNTIPAATQSDVTSTATANGGLGSATAASDLLSTVARLSQGLILPLSKTDTQTLTTTTTSSNVSSPAAQPSPPTVLQSPNNNSMSSLSDDGDGEGKLTDGAINDQLCDKSLNLTPGRVLAPAAMNWKTEKSKRLNEHAKSMMGHFKISASNSMAVSAGGDSNVSSQQKMDKGITNQTELWKKYLTRYTANDPCNPRCWLLYKDHYHCNVDNCFNAFKNKEGVRDHARLHDNQEKISEQLFIEYPDDQPCNMDDCEHSSKKLHFHCNWVGCKKSITSDDPVFARLDHFQEHELATRINQAAARRTNIPTSPKFPPKRRGRPPKQAHTLVTIDFSSSIKPELKPKGQHPGYTKYDLVEQCDDDLCIFRQEEHYHCTKPRCKSVTNRLDVIELHCNNFHNFITIPENYAYFDRNAHCRHPNCSNNRNSAHYHCLRPGCDHSFIRHTTVAAHDKKHQEMASDSRSAHVSGKVPILPKPSETEATKEVEVKSEPALADKLRQLADLAMLNQSNKTPESSANHSTFEGKSPNQKTIKATGTFFPQTSISSVLKNEPLSSPGSESGAETSSERRNEELDPSALPQMAAGSNQQAAAMLNLLTQMLVMQQKQQLAANSASEDEDTWQKMLGRMYASPQVPCGNVFCKKKQVEHYHCLDCGTAFNKTHESRLRTHISKHGKFSLTATSINSNDSSVSTSAQMSNDVNNMASQPASSSSLSNMLNAFMQQQAALLTGPEGNSPTPELALADSSTEEQNGAPSSIQDMMMQALQLQVVGGNKKGKQNATNQSYPEPEGYRRYQKHEDCGFSKCAHSRTSTHYHCIRDDCGYSVNEESRLSQHTQRHDKLDKIMGDDFKLYRMNADCGRSDCEFTNKTAHFHCLLCPYICTDASKILPHRKNHNGTALLHANDSCDSINETGNDSN